MYAGSVRLIRMRRKYVADGEVLKDLASDLGDPGVQG